MQFQHLKEKMAELKGLGQIIPSMGDITDERMQKIVKLLQDMKSNGLCSIDNKGSNKKEPDNMIFAASKEFKKENLHSDIIHYILNLKKEYVVLFIKYLNLLDKKIREINIEYYNSPKITRESHKIDILIEGDEKDNDGKKHCIIIENKINNANDTPKQLPNYYRSMKGEGYIVDAILYLSMDGYKQPDKSTWEQEDIELDLDKIIIPCASINIIEPEKGFIKGFIKKCNSNIESTQESIFFEQYIDLLRYLGRYQMDNQQMEKFYELMKDKESYDTVLWLNSMFGDTITKFGDLISYRRERIFYEFIKNGLEPYRWKLNNSAIDAGIDSYIFDVPNESVEIKIYCRCEQDKTTINILLKKESAIRNFDLIKIILDTIGLSDFKPDNDNNICYKEFLFSEVSFLEAEKAFNKDFDTLLSSLKDNKKKEEIIKQISDKLNGKL
jgi:hypothetical protein